MIKIYEWNSNTYDFNFLVLTSSTVSLIAGRWGSSRACKVLWWLTSLLWVWPAAGCCRSVLNGLERRSTVSLTLSFLTLSANEALFFFPSSCLDFFSRVAVVPPGLWSLTRGKQLSSVFLGPPGSCLGPGLGSLTRGKLVSSVSLGPPGSSLGPGLLIPGSWVTCCVLPGPESP